MEQKYWALIVDGKVAEITDVDPAGRYHPDLLWIACEESVEVGDSYSDGEFQKPRADPEEAMRRLIALVQLHMDNRARQSIYDDLKTAVSYADEPASPKYQAEGLAFRAWRSEVWEKFYAIVGEAQEAGEPLPSADNIIGQLPTLELPQV
ncbi:Uncharacterised protein [Achromobacter insolitus]|uniref:hypothetical protein n=1 Tax=Achromobacter insolitus TaxID=217204 RepID=UPI0009EE029F|nr:hypothetical protein [Achromobacter insolitus]OWT54989.1 hypothetical protein CEY08_25665 [Achromobacter insolitus]CAB3678039.1 hypothetical protein LMG6003_01449 [Achromobacter insolitus]VEG72356.1 Uncharacterised protein [Achromobacter insolitus]